MNKRGLTFAIKMIAVSVFIFWLFQFGYYFHSSLSNFKADATSKRPSKDYSYDHIFNKQKLIVDLTYYIRGKEPLSTYTYNKNTIVAVLEIKGTYTKSINDVVNIHKKSTKPSPNVTYNVTYNPKLVELRRISSVNEQVGKLNLNLYGDSIRLEENTDQIIRYRLKLDNMSIDYGNSELIDFHMKKKGLFSSKPEIELMLKKHNQKIYLILAIPKTDDAKIPKNLISSILK